MNNASKFVNRTNSQNTNDINDISILKKIEKFLEDNPRAKLIPYSNTYICAVKELNLLSKSGMVRPKTPSWFCGSVNSTWPYFGLDAQSAKKILREKLSDKEINTYDGTEGDDNVGTSDNCAKFGYNPGSPGYEWCNEYNKKPFVSQKEKAKSYINGAFNDPIIIGETDTIENRKTGNIPSEAYKNRGDLSETFVSDFVFDNVSIPFVPVVGKTEKPCDFVHSSIDQWPSKFSGILLGSIDVNIERAVFSGRTKLTWEYSIRDKIRMSDLGETVILCLKVFVDGKEIVWGDLGEISAENRTYNIIENKCGKGGWNYEHFYDSTGAQICICTRNGRCTKWFDVEY